MEAINDFSCSFLEIVTKKKIQHWYVRITKDSMTIANPYKPIQLTLQYDEHPEFSMLDATYNGGGVEVQGNFKSDKFEMTVYYKDYYEDEDDEDKISSQDGNIQINMKNINFSFPVSYNLAKALIKLGQGITTDLEGAIHVKNY